MNAISLLLARNGFLPAAPVASTAARDTQSLGTVLATLASYGIAPTTALVGKLAQLGRADLAAWWGTTEPVIRAITGSDRNMDDFVVYKNFPAEVLSKTEAEYWIAQILMYIGAPNAWFTEAALPRPTLEDKLTLRVMAEADADTPASVRTAMFAQKAGWTDEMKADVLALLDAGFIDAVDFSLFGSRENAAWLSAAWLMQTRDAVIVVDAPMDVLRIAAAWSGNDAGLRVPGRLASMPRWLRRSMTTWLSHLSQDRLEADFGMRAKAWKPLLHALHTGTVPGALGKASQSLRSNAITTFEGHVEKGIVDRNREVLSLLCERPGVFARRLHQLYTRFGRVAFEVFAQDSVLAPLSVEQLLKLDRYFATITDRTQLLYTPRGKMSKAKPNLNTKDVIHPDDIAFIRGALQGKIKARLDKAFPEGFDVAEDAYDIGLMVNGQESGIGRGTAYAIPEAMTFLRTASYWKTGGNHSGNIWFDNGWTFFDAHWGQKGAVAWDHNRHQNGNVTTAIFSGDPTNSKDMEGRACQMIDLYLDKLEAAGVAYGVWSVLCFSHVPFNKAQDVLATLQWGENAETGKLYEPARAQVVLPLTGEDMAKAVALLDVKARKLVFLDANLPMQVSSAAINGQSLAERVPALLEAMNSTPSMGDLFALASKGSIPVRYRDETPITGKAVVFSPSHADSAITPIDVPAVLALTD